MLRVVVTSELEQTNQVLKKGRKIVIIAITTADCRIHCCSRPESAAHRIQVIENYFED